MNKQTNKVLDPKYGDLGGPSGCAFLTTKKYLNVKTCFTNLNNPNIGKFNCQTMAHNSLALLRILQDKTWPPKLSNVFVSE